MHTARTAAAAALLVLLVGAAPAHAAPAPPAKPEGLLAEVTSVLGDFFCTVFDSCGRKPQGKPKKPRGIKPKKPGMPAKRTGPEAAAPDEVGAAKRPTSGPIEHGSVGTALNPAELGLPGYGPSPWTWPYDPPVVVS
ncbi:hypothetical protein LO762_05100 [Actinocorallia sp. API 0066]|uniref:hypothetical protein n=1 Tax=Actinocorallia sp. API 0066 TaxID=2896846 RepID=UPI001E3315FD|nr:hypothetical protein [Actinocorallia sp. API 0066]MCD0448575.1 hypothetical protein [Actinocorallia sp. API 0066]